jgi:hypothetical protein
MWIRELAERLTGTGVDAYSVHPGMVATNFGGTSRLVRFGNVVVGGHWGRPALSGAEPLIAFSSTLPMQAPSGTYFSRFTPFGRTGAQAADPALRRELFDLLAKLAGVAPGA